MRLLHLFASTTPFVFRDYVAYVAACRHVRRVYLGCGCTCTRTHGRWSFLSALLSCPFLPCLTVGYHLFLAVCPLFVPFTGYCLGRVPFFFDFLCVRLFLLNVVVISCSMLDKGFTRENFLFRLRLLFLT